MASMMKVNAGEVSQLKEFFLVDPAEVKVVWEDNPRFSEFSPAHAKELARQFQNAEIGQLVPVRVTKDRADHTLTVFDGYHRFKAALICREADPNFRIKVEIVSGVNPEEAYELNVADNCVRNEYSPVAKATAAKTMKTRGRDDAHIARVLGCSKTYLTQQLYPYLEAPAPLKAAAAEGAITVSAVVEVTRDGITQDQAATLADRVRAAKQATGKNAKASTVATAAREVKAEKPSPAQAEAQANGESEPTRSKRSARQLLKALEGRDHKSMPVSRAIFQFLNGAWTDEQAASRLINVLDRHEVEQIVDELAPDA